MSTASDPGYRRRHACQSHHCSGPLFTVNRTFDDDAVGCTSQKRSRCVSRCSDRFEVYEIRSICRSLTKPVTAVRRRDIGTDATRLWHGIAAAAAR